LTPFKASLYTFPDKAIFKKLLMFLSCFKETYRETKLFLWKQVRGTMQLKFFDVEYAIEVIDLKIHAVELHSDLKKRQGLYEFDKIFCFTHLPVFLKKGEKYFLIARHWVYSFFVSNAIYSFPAFIFRDESLLNEIFEMDRIEFNIISNRSGFETEKVNEKPRSRKTKTKYKAISTGRVCPFCGGALRGPRVNEQVEGGGYRITCENKSNRNIGEGKGCDFYAILTEGEFKLFRKYELPTSKWLRRLEDKKCPKCNSEIFLRVVPDPKTNKLISYERCRNYKNSTVKNCNYNMIYQGEHVSAP
jgi:predicted nucleic-acid-binding Zn-ribbon protein